MRINILILVMTIILGAGITFWLDGSTSSGTTTTSPVIATKPVNQENLPEFSFVDLKAKRHDINDYEGKIVLINFWATWCAPCVVEFPKLIKLAQENKSTVVIALSSDINDDKIKEFLKKQKALPSNFIVARDPKRKITTDLFQTYKLPETVIVSPSGKIVKKIVGDTDWGSQEIQNLLLSLSQ